MFSVVWGITERRMRFYSGGEVENASDGRRMEYVRKERPNRGVFIGVSVLYI